MWNHLPSIARGATLAGSVAFGVMTVDAQSAFVLYTDRAQWQSAPGGAPDFFEDFNAFTATTTVLPQVVAGGGLTVSRQNGSSYIDAPPYDALSQTPTSPYLRTQLSTPGTDRLMFTFASPVISWGTDMNPRASDLGRTLNVSLDGSFAGTYSLPSVGAVEFRGLIAAAPFKTLSIETAGGFAHQGIDNLAAHLPAQAPAPATLALIAAGLLGLGWRRR